MANTTFFAIPLPADGAQDWVPALVRALNMLTEAIRRTQKPGMAPLLWGDIANGKYLESSDVIRVFGGLDTALFPTRNFVLEGGADFPADVAENQLFVKGDTLYRRSGGAWVAIADLGNDAAIAAGALLVVDLGAVKGSFAVADGADGVANVAPAADRTVLHSSAASPTGWALATVLELLGFSLGKGGLPVGLGGNAAAALAAGADGTMLVANSAQVSGLQWVTLLSRLSALLTARGQLLAGGAAGAVIVPAPASDGHVLLADSSEVGGMRWVPQSELGAVPGVRTRTAGDLFLHSNFI